MTDSALMAAGRRVDDSPLFSGRQTGEETLAYFGIDPAEWTEIFRRVERTAIASVERDRSVIEARGANPAAIARLHVFAAAFALGVEFGRGER